MSLARIYRISRAGNRNPHGSLRIKTGRGVLQIRGFRGFGVKSGKSSFCDEVALREKGFGVNSGTTLGCLVNLIDWFD